MIRWLNENVIPRIVNGQMNRGPIPTESAEAKGRDVGQPERKGGEKKGKAKRIRDEDDEPDPADL